MPSRIFAPRCRPRPRARRELRVRHRRGIAPLAEQRLPRLHVDPLEVGDDVDLAIQGPARGQRAGDPLEGLRQIGPRRLDRSSARPPASTARGP